MEMSTVQGSTGNLVEFLVLPFSSYVGVVLQFFLCCYYDSRRCYVTDGEGAVRDTIHNTDLTA